MIHPNDTWRTCRNLAQIAVDNLQLAKRARWPMDAGGLADRARQCLLAIQAIKPQLSPLHTRRFERQGFDILLASAVGACEVMNVAGTRIDYKREESVAFVAFIAPQALRNARRILRILNRRP